MCTDVNEFKFKLQNEDFGIVPVENVFIRHYMPDAPEGYVKVYLYGLHCLNSGTQIDNQTLACQLGMIESDVVRAWEYWEEQKILSLNYSGNDVIITFFNISAMLNGYHERQKASKAQPDTTSAENPLQKRIQDMYTTIQRLYKSRTISSKETQLFKKMIEEYHFDPETVTYLVGYCMERIESKEHPFTSKQIISYLSTVAEAWHNAGIQDYDSAEQYVANTKQQMKIVYDVFHYLGIKREPMEWEKETIAAWSDSFGYDMTIITEAMRRSNKPNIRYINGVLKNWHDKGFTSLEQIQSEFKSPKTGSNLHMPGEVVISDERKQAYYELDELDEAALWRYIREENHE